MTDRRLIEVDFPLRQVSLDSVHEKNCRHGHISTLHIWPARRPLAACRAALIATLLPDPGDDDERREILRRLAGRVVEEGDTYIDTNGRRKIAKKPTTEGGILHWGRESGPDLEWFRQKIREAYGGRAPRVLDPFAGGGAIPLEAMRLGCEAIAADINPVAWFILKCTLEYPHRLAGRTRPLPDFILRDEAFLLDYFDQVHGLRKTTKKAKARVQGVLAAAQAALPGTERSAEVLQGDLAWHVRAWGRWVLERARAELEGFYPTIDGQPTVAYLWARTVRCKHCQGALPLLKTRWLCRNNDRRPPKRVRLTVEWDAAAMAPVFGIEQDVPLPEGTRGQRQEADKALGAGTMSRSGATCPNPACGLTMTMEDLRQEGQAGRLGAIMTAVVVDTPEGKAYRLPVPAELAAAEAAAGEVERVFAAIPYGLPTEPTPKGGSGASRAFSVDGYGFDQWYKLFTPRQLVALGTFVKWTRAARDAMREAGYPPEWIEAVGGYLTAAVDRVADRGGSAVCHWDVGSDGIVNTFQRFALPIAWDFAEAQPLARSGGSLAQQLDWVARYAAHGSGAAAASPNAAASPLSAAVAPRAGLALVLTDPPYYDAIPYSDLMDFFYVWLRRTLAGLSPEIDDAFREPLGPKWDHERGEGELVDDSSRFGGDAAASRAAYEEGMRRAFAACGEALEPDGRLVVVFANKQPEAWEALVSSIIRAGFTVTASWPIETEMANRVRAFGSAALSSSIWLVCRKRPAEARDGWDTNVLAAMRERITARLHDFWDAGIRGPDFVWAATGPALEAYSRHPRVLKVSARGEELTVAEFLREVREMVVEFVVGRVLHSRQETVQLDPVTTYYLLHRHDYGFDPAPIGAVILYSLSCGVSDGDLMGKHDLLALAKSPRSSDWRETDEAEEEEEDEADGGTDVRLKSWKERRRRSLGEAADAPLIDRIHRLMHLWAAGEQAEVDAYLRAHGLLGNALFPQVLQALVELSSDDERRRLEYLSNHVKAQRVERPEWRDMTLPEGT